MQTYPKGIICAVTGAGKTLVGVADTIREFNSEIPKTKYPVLRDKVRHIYMHYNDSVYIIIII